MFKNLDVGPSHPIILRPEWIMAIQKAASILRFQVNNLDDLTESAKDELWSVSDKLVQIENAIHHGYSTSKVMLIDGDRVAEEAFYDSNGNMIGYYSYGSYDTSYPYQG